MGQHMELTKKTTILFPPELFDQLAQLASQRRSSVGELVRSACRQQYSLATRDERMAAVQALCNMNLPVGTVEEMIRESVPPVEPLP